MMLTMNNAIIIHVVVPKPLRQHYDYLTPSDDTFKSLQPGVRVRVPFGRRDIIGIVIGTSNKSDVPKTKLKNVLEVIDTKPLLTKTVLKLCHWLADYYHHPLGEIIFSAYPRLLRQGKETTTYLPDMHSENKKKNDNHNLKNILELNSEQKSAVQQINEHNSFHTFLLDGVTGSGKTEVYLRVIENILQQNKQALILVPEIGLTPQTIDRFQKRFDVPLVSLHSKLTEKERAKAWLSAKEGVAKIIIGTRSAIFTPLKNPGVIILDEEHDASFKQQSNLKYNARDVACVRGKIENIPVILGSATPSLASLHNVKNDRFTHLQLFKRAGKATQPSFKIIDLKKQNLNAGLSSELISAIKQTLDKNHQVLIFLNRRGHSSVLMCHHCGHSIHCTRCDSKMTWHQNKNQLLCHHCNSSRRKPDVCSECGQKQFMFIGTGTEKIEEALTLLFPDKSILRIDRDNTRKKDALKNMLAQIESGEADILIGTQMLAKGHHFPNVTLVGIVDADGGLYSADYFATERMGQLITQVAGRAGRADKPGRVIIQTHHPENTFLQILTHNHYSVFANALLDDRKLADLPPFSCHAIIRAEATKQDAPQTFLNDARKIIENNQLLTVYGPIPSSLPKKAGHYRSGLVCQAPTRQALQHALFTIVDTISRLRPARHVRWSVDVDPIEQI